MGFPFDLIDADPTTYGLCFGAILLSSATHRVTGQAFGLICAPLIALAAPGHVPALILLCGLPVMIYGFRSDWGSVRWSEISYAFGGRVAGAIVAATLLSAIADNQTVSIWVGALVLLGVALSLTSVEVSINPGSLTLAGFLSGVMATMTSVGAPPMGLLYQRKSFAHARATLNVFFLFGALASVAVLLAFGLIKVSTAWLTVGLLPAIWAGVALGDLALRHLAIRSIRPFVLCISAGAGIFLLIRAATA